MFDTLNYNREAHPNTGDVANLLAGSQTGFRWSLDFFGWARQEVEARRATEKDVFLKFKESISKSLAMQDPLRANTDKIDWPALFNFIEELTRPSKPEPWLPSVVLRAPADV